MLLLALKTLDTWSQRCEVGIRLKPCPFGLGLRKFALDPTLVNFFKKCQKITSVGSSAFQKKLQRLDQPTLVIFFENEKI